MYSIYGSYDQHGVPDIELCKRVQHTAFTIRRIKTGWLGSDFDNDLFEYAASQITQCMNHPMWSPGKLYEFLDNVDKHALMSAGTVPGMIAIKDYKQCISTLHRTAYSFLMILRIIEKNDAADATEYCITAKQLRRIL